MTDAEKIKSLLEDLSKERANRVAAEVRAEAAEADVKFLKKTMSAAASMAGKHWLRVQLALAEALGNGGVHLDWMLSEYKKICEE